ncbi:MAG: hypothetical protein QNK36_07490 [Colwellia sp.]|nr:hypothetical protein [Colwellia sp.]
MNVECVRDYLAGKHKGVGYLLGASFGAITPFCSCSSFLEFILLKQVMQWRLLTVLFVLLLVAFTLIGWIFNYLTPFI